MAQSVARLQAGLMRGYYRHFSKYARGRKPGCKIAWVTAFTPVEILEALGIAYYYPESYAAVIAASGREGGLMSESERQGLSPDCCSYACCFDGCMALEEGPRGVPPKPDVLIATNNQCNTLPCWWNKLAMEMDVPLIVLDYPGEECDPVQAMDYVTTQHRELIARMEELSGNSMDYGLLDELIANSERSVDAWNGVLAACKGHDIAPTQLFDGISFLITSRCKPQTEELYRLMADELKLEPVADESLVPVFWLGYPLWYHSARYLEEALDGMRVVGSNYVTWWSLDYSGGDCFERLFTAYNYTFLNLSQRTRTERLTRLVEESGAKGAITLKNKSCKCDFVSARDVGVPQAELDIDMIDRDFMDVDRAKQSISLLREVACEG